MDINYNDGQPNSKIIFDKTLPDSLFAAINFYLGAVSSYQGLADMALKIWALSNYSDIVRRCALRDLLGQLGGMGVSSRALSVLLTKIKDNHFEPMVFTDLLVSSVIDNTGIRRDFRWLLSTSQHPLLEELLTETWYCLEQQVWPEQLVERDLLIEFLIGLADEDLGRDLWRHHSYQSNLDPTTAISIAISLRFQKQTPIWLQAELWSYIVKAVQEEACTFELEMGLEEAEPREEYILPPICQEIYQAICDIIDFSAKGSLDNSGTVVSYLSLLEQSLPEDVSYASLDGIIDLRSVLHIPDQLALTMARRCLINDYFDWDSLEEDNQAFLYFLRGYVAIHTPEDGEFIARLEQIIQS